MTLFLNVVAHFLNEGNILVSGERNVSFDTAEYPKHAPVLLSMLEVEMNNFNVGRKLFMRDKMRARWRPDYYMSQYFT